MKSATLRRYYSSGACCFAVGALLTACASVSNVVATGPGTYMVAAHGIDGNGSGAAQKAIAFEAANSYCKARGEQMVAIHSEMTEPFFGRAPSAEVEFRCVKP